MGIGCSLRYHSRHGFLHLELSISTVCILFYFFDCFLFYSRSLYRELMFLSVTSCGVDSIDIGLLFFSYFYHLFNIYFVALPFHV